MTDLCIYLDLESSLLIVSVVDGDGSIKCTSANIPRGVLGTIEFSPYCFNHRNLQLFGCVCLKFLH